MKGVAPPETVLWLANINGLPESEGGQCRFAKQARASALTGSRALHTSLAVSTLSRNTLSPPPLRHPQRVGNASDVLWRENVSFLSLEKKHDNASRGKPSAGSALPAGDSFIKRRAEVNRTDSYSLCGGFRNLHATAV